jgi:hypothetical protein
MTDRLNQELNDLLGELHVEVEESSHQPTRIALVCLSHRADRQDWQRVAQHLDVLRRQASQQLTCEITKASFECNPGYALHIDKATQAVAQADIIVIGLSVDMQLLLQTHEELATLLLVKLKESKCPHKTWGEGPYLLGVRMRALFLENSPFARMELLPPSYALAGQHQKDETCVEVARQIQTWVEDLLEARRRSTED